MCGPFWPASDSRSGGGRMARGGLCTVGRTCAGSEVPGLGRRWLSACDVPDLELLPERWPGLREATFHAGLELAPLHLGLWVLVLGSAPWAAQGLGASNSGRSRYGPRAGAFWHRPWRHAGRGGGPFVRASGSPKLDPGRGLGARPLGSRGPSRCARAARPLERPATGGRSGLSWRAFPRSGSGRATSPRHRDIHGAVRRLRTRRSHSTGEYSGSAIWSCRRRSGACTIPPTGSSRVAAAKIERGRGIVPRLLGLVLGLPAAGDDVPIELRITVRGAAETWAGKFGDRPPRLGAGILLAPVASSSASACSTSPSRSAPLPPASISSPEAPPCSAFRCHGFSRRGSRRASGWRAAGSGSRSPPICRGSAG